MDDVKYNCFKEQYNSFQESIEKKIKEQKLSYQINECFLINNSLVKQIKTKFNQYDKNKTSKRKKDDITQTVLILPNKESEIINNKSSAIQFFQKEYNLKLIAKNVLESLYDSKLLMYNTINYFAGYNKLIIEYKEENSNNVNNSLLLINPFQLINNNYKSYIIAFKNAFNNSLDLYQKILTKEINSYYYQLKNNIVDTKYDNECINCDNISSLFENYNNLFNDKLLKRLESTEEKSKKKLILYEEYELIKKKLIEAETKLKNIEEESKIKINKIINEYKCQENQKEENLRIILKEKENKIIEFNKDLEERINKIKQIEEENERQKKDLIKYEKEINELKSSHKNEIENLNNIIKNKCNENEKKYEQIINNIQEENTKLSNNEKDLVNKNKELTEKINDLEKNKEQLDRNLLLFQNKINEFEKNKNIFENNINSLKKENKDKEEIENLNGCLIKEIDTKIEENKNLIIKNKDLEKKLMKLKKNIIIC